MKKLVSIMAVAAFMLSMNVNAQEPKKKAKKETAKTEFVIITFIFDDKFYVSQKVIKK